MDHTSRESEKERYVILHKQDSAQPRINLLLLFMKGDPRIPDAFRWASSIQSRATAIFIQYKEVLEQIPRCHSEMKEIQSRGYGSGIEHLKLSTKYESFLNSIYALCENLGIVIYYLYRSKSLPRSFREQKSKFLTQDTLDPEYADMLKNTNWYDEANLMRAEATHYLSGLTTYASSATFGYFNVPKSEKKDTLKSIDIDDVEKHAKGMYHDVMAFLGSFGDHFIRIIDQESRVAVPCLRTSSGLIGVRRISLREYLNNEPGACLTKDFDCPRKDSCEARKLS
jgi:hypothetical protein